MAEGNLERLDPLLASAFHTSRYLSQIAEAIGRAARFGPLTIDAALRIMVDACDRVEHVAQEMIPGGFAEWPDNRAFIAQRLADSVEWMKMLLGDAAVATTLAKLPSACPTGDDLAALADTIAKQVRA